MGRVPDYHHTTFSGEASKATRGVRADNYLYSPQNLGELVAAGLDEVGNELKRQQNEQNHLAEKAALTQTSANVERNLAVIANKHKTDPEGFRAEAEAKKAEWLQEVPADKNSQYSLLFNEQQANFDSAIVRNQLRQADEYQKQTFLEASQKYQDDAFKAARFGNPELQQQNYQSFLQNRDALFKGGHISAEKFVAMGRDFANNVEIQNELGKFDKVIPQGDATVAAYIDNFEKRTDLTPERRSAISNALAGEYNNQQVRNRVLSVDTLKDADFVVASLDAGMMPEIDPDEVSAKLRSLGNIRAAQKVEQSRNIYYEAREFAKLTPPQMSESLNLKKDNLKTPEDLARYKALSGLYNKSLTMLQDDPLGFSVNYGVVTDSGFSLNEPDKIKNRIENAKFVKEKYGLRVAPIATKSEIKTLSNTISQADAAGKSEMLGQIYKSYDGYAEQILKEIAPKNPEFAHAAAIFPTSPEIAKNLLDGAEIAKKQIEYTPSKEKNFDMIYYNIVGDNFLTGATAETREGIKNSVKSYLAGLNYKAGKTDRTVDSSKVQQAVKEVIGDFATYNRPGWFSGSFKTVLPHGVSANNFTAWLNELPDTAFAGALNDRGYQPTAEEIRELGTLIYSGSNRYRVLLNNSILYSPGGTPFVLTYDREG